MTTRVLLLVTVACVLAVPVEAQQSQSPTVTAETVENPFPDRVIAPEAILDGGKEWLNTTGPIRLKDLRGKIVVLDFWTYCCINCLHVLPDLKYLEQKYPNELVVIGVHSAKFDNEKDADNIRQAIMRHDIEHPVVNDADMIIWKKFGVRSWPTLAIIDPEGYYCGAQPGEGNRELFDAIVGRLVKYHRAKKTLDESPVQFKLEREQTEPTPLRYPGKVLADPAGKRLFIADTGNNRIVVSDMDGKLLETIGTGAIGLRDGSFAEAEFDHPQGMALAEDQLFVADTENHSIRVVDLKQKTVSTIAGTGKQARRRVSGGPAKTTALNSPWALQHLDGILFIAMAGPHQIWQHVIGSDEVSVYAGSGAEDVVNGSLLQAALAQPSGLASDGNWLYVADSEGSAIRRIGTSADSEVSTIAGTSGLPRGQSLFEFDDIDGIGDAARFQHPLGVALGEDVLYVADSYNHKIRRIDLKTNKVTTWIGTGTAGSSLAETELSEPSGLSITKTDLLIADTNNHRILRANLTDKTVAAITIEGLKPPDPPKRADFEDLKPIVLAAQTVKQSEMLNVSVGLDVPEGYKINKEMPIVWQASNVDSKSPVLSADSGFQNTTAKNNTVQIALPMSPEAKQGQVQIVIRYGYCRDGVGGLCKMATTCWRVPLDVQATGSENVSISAQSDGN